MIQSVDELEEQGIFFPEFDDEKVWTCVRCSHRFIGKDEDRKTNGMCTSCAIEVEAEGN